MNMHHFNKLQWTKETRMKYEMALKSPNAIDRIHNVEKTEVDTLVDEVSEFLFEALPKQKVASRKKKKIKRKVMV